LHAKELAKLLVVAGIDFAKEPLEEMPECMAMVTATETIAVARLVWCCRLLKQGLAAHHR